MTGRLILLTIVAALVVPCPGVAAQGSPLQSVLDSARAALHIPGAAGAVIFADGTRWEGASGVAAPDSPASPATAFELGSVAKVYTATLVLGLVAEGRLDLQDRLRVWFPDLPGSDSITVAQLLSHTHGLHDPLQEPDFVPAVLADPTKVWTIGDVITRMRGPHFEPGADWRYSNTGFHILGAIVECVTDSTFADVLRAHVLEPLGLADTWYGPDDPEGVTLAAAYIDPSGSGMPQPVSLLMPWTAFRTAAGPAGAVMASASDAARFVHDLAGGAVLGEAEWRLMTSWVDRPDGHKYGLGLLRIEEEGGPLLGHKGNSAGYSASAFHDPRSGITAVVLTNAHAVDVTPLVTALLRTAAQHQRP